MKRRLVKQFRKMAWWFGDTPVGDLPRWAMRLLHRAEDRAGLAPESGSAPVAPAVRRRSGS